MTDPAPTSGAPVAGRTTDRTADALPSTLRSDAQGLLPDLVRLRREIHRDPELGMHLPRTQQRVLEALEGTGIELRTGDALSSVIGVVRGAHPGPVTLLRGDMDALPMRERTGLDFAADGEAMHACGHDLHVAGLVGAGRLLAQHRDQLHGDVVLMFQPGEEVGDGAQAMLAEGVVAAAGRPADAAFAIHVVPGEYGYVSTRPGTIMAGSFEFSVRIHGRGGHASAPHLTIDPIPVAAQLVTALQSFVTRRVSVFDPVVLSVTQLQAGGVARNVVPDTAEIAGSIRVLSRETQELVETVLPGLIRDVCAAGGCTATVELALLCPTTVNDPAETEHARAALGALLGEDRVWESPAPVMGSEDFSYVLQEVPGTLLFLRATPPEVDLEAAAPNHSPEVVFDDRVLADQAAALAALALAPRV
ncbi:M20 family metallopeptidase [Leucobacter rhizosphaerae]|uniref:M20 family metallopeptidase n=1 Tax=Leucobacter rhizosphaerae TaxID=2932245 RepID=A0ABY4FTU1_9MICO|nr:M20 family metallopeptidase [Leucobacter rhizosphaerae]UOQ59579.1 M20 family metallopeptidase [Leucobacter rhizosphaerae]